MSGLLVNGPEVHEHNLPPHEVLRPGAVAQCPGCGRFFVLDPIPWERTWRLVRWWDRKARRVIREQAEKQLPGPARRGMGAMRW